MGGDGPVSAWTDYATQLLPAVVPAAAGSGAPAWVLLAMAAHESGVPPVPGSSLVYGGEHNPWGVGCNGTAGSCAVYPTLAAAGQALPGLLPANALAVAGNPQAFMAALQADDWSGDPYGDYASSVVGYWGPLAQSALQAIGVDPVTGQGGGGVTSGQVRPAPVPWWAIGGGAALLAGGVAVALRARR